MTIEIPVLLSSLDPEKTTILFGAGSSLPSHAASVADLQRHFENVFSVPASGYSLAEQTGIIEKQFGRRRLIEELRTKIQPASPTGAILNLPLYDWRNLFTTNYDHIIEIAYRRRGRKLITYTSNFDFGKRAEPTDPRLYKLHGTIDKDLIDGDQSRIILTEADYDHTEDYREKLFDRLKADGGDGLLIVIGHSLADPDIRSVIDRAAKLNRESAGSARVVFFIYEKDQGRALLAENRGLEVCFGGLDDFFAALSARVGAKLTATASSGDVLDLVPALRPSTIDIQHQLSNLDANVSNLYNGWPASYSDISAGLTFERDATQEITRAIIEDYKRVAVVLGPSGVGKTTAARQVQMQLRNAGYVVWEHKSDQQLLGHRWREVAALLRAAGNGGCLLIDDAHAELSEVNDLLDGLNSDSDSSLHLILVSSENKWLPRIKSPSLYKSAQEILMGRISSSELDRLLSLIDSVPALGALVEHSFAGFSRPERRRRLVQRCESEMFVCFKNIFASEKFDDIVLREYADLVPTLQDIYKVVAAMQAAGVRVHRQLVIRLLGINMSQTASILTQLTGIIHERSVDEKQGVYVWTGRHRVISEIIAEYKYFKEHDRYKLLSDVIDAIQPSYDIELKTIREICSDTGGIQNIPDKKKQNILLRKMLSIAPRERVPRHKLIRNLIDLGAYDVADTEVRLFENDFRLDGPAARYKIDLALARAVHSPGLMNEDRIVLLEKAAEIAYEATQRFRLNKQVLSSYCEVGVQLFRFTGEDPVFLQALEQLRNAEQKTADTDITRRIVRYEHRIANLRGPEPVLDALEIEE